MTARNRCGTCTLCCKVVGVLEIEKKPNEWCRHCEVGSGCRIYEKRPSSCQAFTCMWFNNTAWSDELRPDRSHVVLEGLEDRTGMLAMVDPDYPDAWETGPMAGLLRALGGQGVSTFVTHREPRDEYDGVLLLGKGRTANDFWDSVYNTALNQMRREAAATGRDLHAVVDRTIAQATARVAKRETGR